MFGLQPLESTHRNLVPGDATKSSEDVRHSKVSLNRAANRGGGVNMDSLTLTQAKEAEHVIQVRVGKQHPRYGAVAWSPRMRLKIRMGCDLSRQVG